MHASKTISSMHMLSEDHLSFKNLIWPREYWNVTPTDIVKHIQSISSSILETGITWWSRDSKQVEFWAISRINNGESII